MSGIFHLMFGGSDAKFFSIVLSSNTYNFNLRTAMIGLGWDSTSRVNAVVTVNSGVVVGSTSTGSFAFDTGILPANSNVILYNYGYIVGKGGTGAGFTGAIGTSYSNPGNMNQPGESGGPALRAQTSIRLYNYGIIGGGGGGGASGNHF
jgi:hypothetical protein